MELLAAGYAALNVASESAAFGQGRLVEGDGEVVARRRIDGAPIVSAARSPSGRDRAPDWDELEIFVGGETVALRFQIVASPRGRPPSFPLGPGDAVHLRARVDGSLYEVTILDPDGQPILLAARAPPEGLVTPHWSAVAGPTRRAAAHVTFSDVRLSFRAQPPVEIPAEGWHVASIGGEPFAIAAEHLVAEAPSAMASHLRFGAISRGR